MGMVVMSKRELNRLEVLARLDSDRLTAQAAAEQPVRSVQGASKLADRSRCVNQEATKVIARVKRIAERRQQICST
jgi:hypothetical protein